MSAADIAEIAGKMTKAQRVALRDAAPKGFGLPANCLFHAGRASTGTALYVRGFVRQTGALTVLGLAVRRHLQKTQA